MTIPATIPAVLELNSRRFANNDAILAPNRSPLTHANLYAQVCQIVETLNRAGVGRNDRVAVVLPDGPENAVTAIGTICGATYVPMSMSLPADEFAAYFLQSRTAAVILQKDTQTEARVVAYKQGLSVIEVVPTLDAAAGVACLEFPPHSPA